ncbi:hypothetical protein QV08_02715 [Gallibacterium salpingitidis]|uniref:hypothetical protein n=1 Tax=Gallibacterium salpingitidis TaxID=505341 RepID=UPI000805F2C3|nr:hypothetical protein [Gallibacterium salpingitidis]OBX09160.1 hypothetical protein QV08_02715 [Gallibacterium salpingitidis]
MADLSEAQKAFIQAANYRPEPLPQIDYAKNLKLAQESVDEDYGNTEPTNVLDLTNRDSLIQDRFNALNRNGNMYDNPTDRKRMAVAQAAEQKRKNMIDTSSRDFERNLQLELMNGADPNEINHKRDQFNYLNSLDGNSRLQNYLAYLQGDPNTIPDEQMHSDLEYLEVEDLQIKYGDVIGSFARRLNREIVRNAFIATTYSNSGYSKNLAKARQEAMNNPLRNFYEQEYQKIKNSH